MSSGGHGCRNYIKESRIRLLRYYLISVEADVGFYANLGNLLWIYLIGTGVKHDLTDAGKVKQASWEDLPVPLRSSRPTTDHAS